MSLTDLSSLFIVIILERHGKYNNENATNEIDAARVKLDASPPDDAGYKTDRVDTIISFAPTPTNKAEDAFQVPNPSGANIGAIALEMSANMLFFISFIGVRFIE